MSHPPSSNYLPHEYSHQQPFLHQSHSSSIRDILLYGSESRPPMLLSGTFTVWQQRFLQWLTYRPHADLMLKSIRDGPYNMKFLADSTGLIRLQTDEDLHPNELIQYNADQHSAWSITLGLPNSIYIKVDCLASAQEMWNCLEDMHSTEELHHIIM